jgi:hypothetical protein
MDLIRWMERARAFIIITTKQGRCPTGETGRKGIEIMKNLTFEVKRLRGSVTQGEAAVYCNGVKLVQFGDNITMGGEHGDIIGNWGSTKSDEEFINAALFPDEIRRNYYPQEVNAIFDKIKALIAE